MPRGTRGMENHPLCGWTVLVAIQRGTFPSSMVIVQVAGPEGKVIEGVFDGQIMIGPDGKNYPVPANYASKSKLVEGDILKLTITPEGRFLYKQIGPVERKTVIGTLTHHDDKYYIEVHGREYEVLYASVTYFHLREGSQVSAIIPANNDQAAWAAIEAAL